MAKMFSHTWEDPEINQIWMQNQAKQDDPPKKAQQKGPIYVRDSNYHEGTTFSLSPPMCLSTCTLLPPNKHFTCFTTFCLCVEIHFYTADGPGPYHWSMVPGGLVTRIQPSVISGQEPKSCSKPLQAEGTRDQPLSHSHKSYF